jgi:glycine betaine/proline transport system substrate-binding protein
MRYFAMCLAVGMMVVAGCRPAEPGGAAGGDKPKVELAYVSWDGAIAATNVLKAIIEDELGYECEIVPVSAAVMWQATATGDYDGFVAGWLPVTHADYLASYTDDIVDLGPNLTGAKIGLVVPAYVTIDSIDQLNANADQFDGRITGIDPGAGVMKKAKSAIDVYDMTDMELLSSSDAVMTATLAEAIEDQQWIVVTGWSPHWKFARWDLKFLADPKGVFGGAESVHTIVRVGLEQDKPEVYALLDNFEWSTDEIAQLMAANQQDGADLQENARQWIADHPDRVRQWLAK